MQSFSLETLMCDGIVRADVRWHDSRGPCVFGEGFVKVWRA